MLTKFEGLILSKIPQGEKDLLLKVLLRSGHKTTLLLYGGQSSRRGKSAGLEVGMLNAFEITPSGSSSLLRGRECKVLWHYEFIRHNYEAFCFMCFALNLVELTSPEFPEVGENEEARSSGSGAFSIISNALSSLEEGVKTKKFEIKQALFMFFSRMLKEHGLFPTLETCILSGHPFSSGDQIHFIPEEGGFQKVEGPSSMSDDNELWQLLLQTKQTKYQELWSLPEVKNQLLQKLFSFMLYRLDIPKHKIKGVGFLSVSL